MLTGEAKKAYQREYMRKKRAGLVTRKPRKEWQPTQHVLAGLDFWASHSDLIGAMRRDSPIRYAGRGTEPQD